MRFAHTNIAAKNWKTLSDFYIHVFDCKIKPPQRKLSGAWLDRATGLRNAMLEGVHLLLPGHGDDGPTLEIFSYREMTKGEPIMAKRALKTQNKTIKLMSFEVENLSSRE